MGISETIFRSGELIELGTVAAAMIEIQERVGVPENTILIEPTIAAAFARDRAVCAKRRGRVIPGEGQDGREFILHPPLRASEALYALPIDHPKTTENPWQHPANNMAKL